MAGDVAGGRGGGLDIEEIGSAEGLAALEPEWAALHARCPDASPFQSPAWLLAWLETFRPERPWALAIRDGGRLVALLPCFVWRGGMDGAAQLTLLGNGISDRLDLLAEPGRAAAAAPAVFERLGRDDGLWTTLDWRDLPAASPLLAGPLPGRSGREDEEPCPARPLPTDPDEVLAALPRKRRDELRRRGRRLAETGAVAVRRADAASLERDLEALLALHGRRWGERGEDGVLADPQVEAFHRAAAPRLLAAGLLRLHLLELDGRPLAAHYGFRHGATAYSYIHGFDPAVAVFAPTSLLLLAVMEEATREGATTFDFLRGREPYKYAWGAVDQPQHRRRAAR
jgi:CelD/BcsL family acetyltransferase involved in cellulose biosynthesis